MESAESPLLIFQRADENIFDILFGQGLKRYDMGSGDQSPIDFKIRVFRGRADKSDLPLLNGG